MQNILKKNERIEDIQFGGLRLIQNPSWFCYGIDAVLIAKFCEVKEGWKGVDLGTGTGIIPLLLSQKMKEIIGVEIQTEVAEMAKRSIKLNELEDKIKIFNIDMNEYSRYIKPYSMDVVISNPPYMAKDEGLINDEDIKAISRHEIKASLEDVVSTAHDLLKDRGHFYLVHRPHRLVDILCLCRKYRLEPKRIRFVHPKKDKKPNILLLHCTKYGKPELKFLDPLYVYKEDGTYSDEIYQIYEKEKKE